MRLLMDEPNVLLLDEPTNDLDIDTLTALEDLLDGWPGTLVVVSHDRYFVERVCDDVYALTGDGGAAPPAGRHRAVRRAAPRAAEATAAPRRAPAAPAPPRPAPSLRAARKEVAAPRARARASSTTRGRAARGDGRQSATDHDGAARAAGRAQAALAAERERARGRVAAASELTRELTADGPSPSASRPPAPNSTAATVHA